MRFREVAAAIAVVLPAACGGTPRSSPPRHETLATYTLSGTVSEMTPAGPVPVDGARIEETRTHLYATTDGGGFYSLYGMYPSTSTFWTSKPGFVTDKESMLVDRDLRLNISLKRASRGDSSSRGAIALPSQEAK